MNDADFTVSPPTILPDGSGFGTITLPLPDYHWLYYKPENDGFEPPPMTMRAPVNHPLREAMTLKVREALRYALRVTTNCGKDNDFDPDALEQNLIIGLFGYHTEDGFYSADDWVNSDESMTIDELAIPSGERWFHKYHYPSPSDILSRVSETSAAREDSPE